MYSLQCLNQAIPVPWYPGSWNPIGHTGDSCMSNPWAKFDRGSKYPHARLCWSVLQINVSYLLKWIESLTIRWTIFVLQKWTVWFKIQLIHLYILVGIWLVYVDLAQGAFHGFVLLRLKTTCWSIKTAETMRCRVHQEFIKSTIKV